MATTIEPGLAFTLDMSDLALADLEDLQEIVGDLEDEYGRLMGAVHGPHRAEGFVHRRVAQARLASVQCECDALWALIRQRVRAKAEEGYA